MKRLKVGVCGHLRIAMEKDASRNEKLTVRLYSPLTCRLRYTSPTTRAVASPQTRWIHTRLNITCQAQTNQPHKFFFSIWLVAARLSEVYALNIAQKPTSNEKCFHHITNPHQSQQSYPQIIMITNQASQLRKTKSKR